MIAAQNLAGLLNLESLNMSKNRLDDESFGPNSLPVRFLFHRALHGNAVDVGTTEHYMSGKERLKLGKKQWKSDDKAVKLERP